MRRFDEPFDPARRYRERPGAYAVIRDGDDVLVTEQTQPAPRVPAARRRHRSRRGPAPGPAPRVPRGDRLAHRGHPPARRLAALRVHAGVRLLGAQGLPRLPRPAGAPATARRPSPATTRSGCRSRPRSTLLTMDGDRAFVARAVSRPQHPLERLLEARPVGRAERAPAPGRNGSAARRSAIRSRSASRSPTFFSVNGAPSGASARAPRATQAAASGTSAVTQRSPGPMRSAIQRSAASAPRSTTTTDASGCRDGRMPPLLT